jgi:predicted phosphoribosyltransferase
MHLPFRDRTEAGRELARMLETYRDHPDAIVLALPRGGVPVAFEIAQHLNAPLDVFVARKLGVPGHEELALGAISTGGVRVLNYDVVYSTGIVDSAIDALAEAEGKELERRERAYRDDRPAPEVEGKIAILVDDGLATGATMLAAARALGKQKPAKIVVAVPVAAPEVCEHFRKEVDEVVCAATPQPFRAVGLWYEEFPQTSDDEVRELLARAAKEHV